MKSNTLIRGIAIAGVLAIILGAMLPALSAINY
jgi:hypothetical protein